MPTVMLLFCVQCVCVKAGVDALVQNVQRVFTDKKPQPEREIARKAERECLDKIYIHAV